MKSLSCLSRCAGALIAAVLLCDCPATAQAVDQVTFRRKDQQQDISGKLLVTAKDGGLMLLSADGTLWNIEPEEIVTHTQDAQTFAPLSQADASKKLLAELPAGFESLTTAHYVIGYGTSRAYAQWVGAMYERLYNAFNNYWKDAGSSCTIRSCRSW